MRSPAEIVWFILWTVCVAQDCQGPPPKKPTEILSGSWPDQTYPEGKQAVYKCRPGYRTLGTITVVCRAGEWVSTNPARICRKKPCGHPGDAPFGSFQLTVGNEFEFGARVVYTCDEGYQLLGEINFRDCAADGWTNNIPTCEIVKCLPISEPENGRIVSSTMETDQEYHFGQVIQFECNPGFRREGSKEVHCSEAGRWSSEKPTCVEISCTLPEIHNGQPLSRGRIFKENERFQYKCNPGFEFVERGEAVCTGSGWSPPPACEEMTCKPPYIPNGVYSPHRIKHRTEDKVTYACKEGFYPATRQTVVKCTRTGWVPAPRCSLKPCDFPTIKHGHLYGEERHKPYFPVPIGKEFNYYCNHGFVTPVSHSYWGTISCTTEGWKPEVLCIKQCEYGYLENGDNDHWARFLYVQGQSVQVPCYSGFSLSNGQNIATCTENSWEPPLKCIRVKRCSKSEIEVKNGFLSQTDYTYAVNKQTEYKCKPGYITADGKTSGTVTCLQSGWSAQPSCIKFCDKPVLENARSKNNASWFKLNDKLDYECDVGYENRNKRSRGSIQCGPQGWSETPSCYERECKIPKMGKFLRAEPKKEKYKVGDVLKFSCQPGLIRVGPDSVQCYHFGWSPNIPVCKDTVQPCGPPPELHNGEMRGALGEYRHGHMVEYTCNSRFLMKGPEKIQCVDGTWTSLPTCIEETRICREIPEIFHGLAQPSEPPFHHGDTVEFQCMEDFVIIGQKAVTCKSGAWTQLPQCVAREKLEKCRKPRSVIPVAGHLENQEYPHDFVLSYRCRGKQEHLHSVCVNGRWDPEPQCPKPEGAPCAPPPQIPHAQALDTTVNYPHEGRVSVLCLENYMVKERDEMLCLDGKWEFLPRCVEKIGCAPPPSVDHGALQPGAGAEPEHAAGPRPYRHGTELRYVCQDGFRLSGEEGTRCHLGKWTPPPPQCVGLPCVSPPLIENGMVSHHEDTYQFQEEVTYNCSEGFGFEGPSFVKCIGGKWSTPPRCIRTDCFDPPRFNVAILAEPKKALYRSGEQLTYKCPPSYQLNGSSTVTCINGKWIGRPTCKDNSCVDPPRVGNATMVSKQMDKYPSGERVRYECNEPFELFGEVEVMCLNGTWTEPPQCKDSTGKCRTPPPIDNGDITSFPLPAYPPDASVEYQCQSLYRMEGNQNIVCRNGKWSEPPRCLNPCTISEEIMAKHNIVFKWTGKKKLYSQSGEPVEFLCKYGFHPGSAELRVTCHDGHLDYPTCIRRY